MFFLCFVLFHWVLFFLGEFKGLPTEHFLLLLCFFSFVTILLTKKNQSIRWDFLILLIAKFGRKWPNIFYLCHLVPIYLVSRVDIFACSQFILKKYKRSNFPFFNDSRYCLAEILCISKRAPSLPVVTLRQQNTLLFQL